MIREAYIAERSHRLAEQERQVEDVRQEIKILPDMETIGSDDERQAVLRPITLAKTETTEEAVYPSLAELSQLNEAQLLSEVLAPHGIPAQPPRRWRGRPRTLWRRHRVMMVLARYGHS